MESWQGKRRMTRYDISSLVSEFPLLDALISLKELAWFNPNIRLLTEALPYVGLTRDDVAQASARLLRFAPFLAEKFPETACNRGIIESDLVAIDGMKPVLERRSSLKIAGRLLLKKDSHLPIAGSIKARGGIYEVLTHAEHLALGAGLIDKAQDYRQFSQSRFRQFFQRHRIVVGSTGNLGLSIGIISAKLGFSVTVHMSSEARQWKKEKLRQHGAKVVEHDHDYSMAVTLGRQEAEADPNGFFIDDENSPQLFLGYAVAGERLKAQFHQQGILVDKAHPLFVYLPCGVGGGPGGLAFGLKLAFGDHVHCIFAEPTRSPCMFLGVYTGLHNQICVQDLGIDNQTAADGLAVGRASGFVGRAMERLIDGYYTIEDKRMFALLGELNETTGIQLEPSALAGLWGPVHVLHAEAYLERMAFTPQIMAQTTHVVWGTGGGMVPQSEMATYLMKANGQRTRLA